MLPYCDVGELRLVFCEYLFVGQTQTSMVPTIQYYISKFLGVHYLASSYNSCLSSLQTMVKSVKKIDHYDRLTWCKQMPITQCNTTKQRFLNWQIWLQFFYHWNFYSLQTKHSKWFIFPWIGPESSNEDTSISMNKTCSRCQKGTKS